MAFHANNDGSNEHASAEKEAGDKADNEQNVGPACSGFPGLDPETFNLHLADGRLFSHTEFMLASQLPFKSLQSHL
ncbi:hypothetical protein PV350_31455 [Streptomyces sp. PA03-6a]|nr:hypothetical protein [Streptomyces sp. PA03-6a]